MARWEVVYDGLFFDPEPVGQVDALFGRYSEMEKLAFEWATTTATSVPIIEGPPGIGKSSLLATFTDLLLRDDPAPTAKWREIKSMLPERKRIILTLRCTPAMVSPSDLFVALNELLDGWTNQQDPRSTHWRFGSTSVEANLPFISVATSLERVPGETRSDRVLAARLRALIERGVEEVVVVIDEAERLSWHEDILEVVRNFTVPQIRFILGVRDFVSSRLGDSRESNYRWPGWIRLGPLTRADIREIFTRAQFRLDQQDVRWEVTPELITAVEEEAGGEPWFPQMVGHVLIRQIRGRVYEQFEVGVRGPKVLVRSSLSDFQRAKRDVVELRLRGSHEVVYLEAVGRSAQRELALRALANHVEREIGALAIREIGVSLGFSVSEHVSMLVKRGVLVRTRSRGVEFASHQFRVFARLNAPVNFPTDW